MGGKWSVSRFWRQSPSFRVNVKVQVWLLALSLILSFILGIVVSIGVDKYFYPIVFPISPPDITVYGLKRGSIDTSDFGTHNIGFFKSTNNTMKSYIFSIYNNGDVESSHFRLGLNFGKNTIFRITPDGDYSDCHFGYSDLTVFRNKTYLDTVSPLEYYNYQPGDNIIGRASMSFYCSRIGPKADMSIKIYTTKDMNPRVYTINEPWGWFQYYYMDYDGLKQKEGVVRIRTIKEK